MKKEKTIVTFVCDVCGKEVENKYQFAHVSTDGTPQVIEKIYLQKYGICDPFIIEDMCWECHEKIFSFIDNLTKSFRYAHKENCRN